MNKKTVYLINPKNDFPNYYGAEVFEKELGRTAVAVSDLAVTTVATLMKPYFNVILCEQHIDPVDFNLQPDFVAITGKITQWHHMRDISIKFRDKGIPVIIGGPYASLSPDTVRPHADILLTGELEEVADEVFRELNSGNWKDHYHGEQADLANAALPAWDLYPNHRSLTGNLQVSRGCPFQCEFCDVIQYLGRKQRHKPISKVLEELDQLYAYGYNSSFIADDNFTVYRSRAKEVLEALAHWNSAVPGRTIKFTTQVSLDVTKDEEMLEMLNRAGFSNVFMGIETPNEDSLKEARKLQNTKVDLVKEIEKIYERGVAVFSGMIVGFDNDHHDIFERQFDFAMQSSIPFFSLNFLYAFESTPLYSRLKKQGRIKNMKDMPWQTQYATNVKIKNLNDEDQYYGMRWLLSNLYAPQNYGERVCQLIDKLGPEQVRTETSMNKNSYEVMTDLRKVIQRMKQLGDEEKEMSRRIMKKLKTKPHTASSVTYFMFLYAQVRYLLDNQPASRPMYVKEDIGKPVFSTV